MRKKQKKVIIFTMLLALLASVFILSIQIIKKGQKIEADTKQETFKDISEYKTGEVLTLADIYQEVGGEWDGKSMAVDMAKSEEINDNLKNTYFFMRKKY